MATTKSVGGSTRIATTWTNGTVWHPHTASGPVWLRPTWTAGQNINVVGDHLIFDSYLRREGISGAYTYPNLFWSWSNRNTAQYYKRDDSTTTIPGGSLPTGAGYVRYAISSRWRGATYSSPTYYSWTGTLFI